MKKEESVWDKIAAMRPSDPPPQSFSISEYAKQFGIGKDKARREIEMGVEKGRLEGGRFTMKTGGNQLRYWMKEGK